MAAINYVLAAATFDPNIGFNSHTGASDYDALIWSSTSIPQATLDLVWYNLEKQRIVNGLISSTRTQVTSGFLSDMFVPGTTRYYQSDLQSQISLIGAVVYTNSTGGSFTYTSYDPVTKQGRIDSYTNAQFIQLLGIFATNISTILGTLQSKANQVIAIDTSDIPTALDTLYAITWS